MDVLKTRSDILDIIESVVHAKGLKNYEISDVKTNQKGEGYLGQIFFVTVRDEETDKELSLILKCAFKDDRIRETAPIRNTFENEIFFYSTIFPRFLEFERSHGVKRPTELVPRCYEASLKNEAEIVVLQNLKPLGFEVFEKRDLLDHEHVKMIFETYGRYHAYSFAYRDQHPKEFEELASKTHDVIQELCSKQVFITLFEGFLEVTKGFFSRGKDDDILRRLEKYQGGENIAEIFRSSTTSDCEHPIIVHGDCWSNNMMFKYERAGGGKKLKEIRLIDWQLLKAASPVCDLSYFLYSGGSKDIFDKLDDYLKIYHDTLSSCIRRLGSDPEALYPFGALKSDWRLYAKYGILMATMLLRTKVIHQDQVMDFTDFGGHKDDELHGIFLNAGYDKELYKKRIVDLFQHTAEIDAL